MQNIFWWICFVCLFIIIIIFFLLLFFYLFQNCDAINLASKYNTFVETSLEFYHMLTFAVKEMLGYYKWNSVGVVVEDAINYRWAYEDLIRDVGTNASLFNNKMMIKYSGYDDFNLLKKNISSFKGKSSSMLTLFLLISNIENCLVIFLICFAFRFR